MRIRILFIHQTGLRGGAGVMLTNIVRALDRDVFEPVVLCPQGDIVDDLRGMDVTVHTTQRRLYQFAHSTGASYPFVHPRFLHDAVRLLLDRAHWRDVIRGIQPDIVHLNSLTLAPLAWSARAAGARVVCVVQETFATGTFGVRTRWLKRLLSQMDATVFISEHEMRSAACSAPIVECIPNWVSLRDFAAAPSHAEARQQLGVANDAAVILMMGGVARIKGTLTLLQAADHLRDISRLVVLIAGYQDHVAVTGAGPFRRAYHLLRRAFRLDYASRVQQRLQQRNARADVRFVGSRADVVPLYAAADVVVFPATVPHQARPVLEAGALKRPVVVSDFPQLHESVEAGRNGLFARPGDAEALAAALRPVLQDPALARRLGEANHAVTIERHSERNAARFVDVYMRLARKPLRGRNGTVRAGTHSLAEAGRRGTAG